MRPHDPAREEPKGAGQPVVYVRGAAPAISVPPYRGDSYEDRVPDTLDLSDRSNLAINALTRLSDPRADYECWFTVQVNRRPMVMSHEWSDYVGQQPKFMEALTLLRTVTGNTTAQDVELGMMTTAARMLGDDGLYYQPIQGRPWALTFSSGLPVTTGTAFSTGLREDELRRIDEDPRIMGAGQFSDSYSCGRMLLAMTLWYQRDSNPFWRRQIDRMIARFRELAVDKGEYAFFPRPFIHPGFLTPGEVPNLTASAVSSHPTHMGAIHGLSRYYRLVGYEPALQLAGKLSRYMRDHSGHYDEEGRAPNQHFHCSTYTLLAMLEYAALAADQDMLEFVRKSYEWHRTVGSSLVGFFPEALRNDYLTSESCEIANMIDLAVRMSQLEVGDYWDDADRYLRNQFAENQLTSGEWMQRISEQSARMPVTYRDSTDDVVARNLGAFAGWSLANDFIGDPPPPLPRGLAFMHCCTGNGSRALYYAWQGIMDFAADELRVNLLLNRASPWADVLSYIPYEGRVDIRTKRHLNLSVRIPLWVERRDVKIIVWGSPRPARWKGQYLRLGECLPQQEVTITFPIAERTVQETIGARPYSLVLKGNDVVAIDPAGTHCPYYNRERYRIGEVQWKASARFVSHETLVI